MKLMVSCLLLVATCHAAKVSRRSREEEERTAKRALQEGNFGLKIQLSQEPSSQNRALGEHDGNTNILQGTPHAEYGPPKHPVAKISDVLSSQGSSSFPAAIESHLYSPVQIYQPRIGSPTTFKISEPVPSQLAYSEHKTFQATQGIQNLNENLQAINQNFQSSQFSSQPQQAHVQNNNFPAFAQLQPPRGTQPVLSNQFLPRTEASSFSPRSNIPQQFYQRVFSSQTDVIPQDIYQQINQLGNQISYEESIQISQEAEEENKEKTDLDENKRQEQKFGIQYAIQSQKKDQKTEEQEKTLIQQSSDNENVQPQTVSYSSFFQSVPSSEKASETSESQDQGQVLKASLSQQPGPQQHQETPQTQSTPLFEPEQLKRTESTFQPVVTTPKPTTTLFTVANQTPKRIGVVRIRQELTTPQPISFNTPEPETYSTSTVIKAASSQPSTTEDQSTTRFFTSQPLPSRRTFRPHPTLAPRTTLQSTRSQTQSSFSPRPTCLRCGKPLLPRRRLTTLQTVPTLLPSTPAPLPAIPQFPPRRLTTLQAVPTLPPSTLAPLPAVPQSPPSQLTTLQTFPTLPPSTLTPLSIIPDSHPTLPPQPIIQTTPTLPPPPQLVIQTLPPTTFQPQLIQSTLTPLPISRRQQIQPQTLPTLQPLPQVTTLQPFLMTQPQPLSTTSQPDFSSVRPIQRNQLDIQNEPQSVVHIQEFQEKFQQQVIPQVQYIQQPQIQQQLQSIQQQLQQIQQQPNFIQQQPQPVPYIQQQASSLQPVQLIQPQKQQLITQQLTQQQYQPVQLTHQQPYPNQINQSQLEQNQKQTQFIQQEPQLIQQQPQLIQPQPQLIQPEHQEIQFLQQQLQLIQQQPQLIQQQPQLIQPQPQPIQLLQQQPQLIQQQPQLIQQQPQLIQPQPQSIQLVQQQQDEPSPQAQTEVKQNSQQNQQEDQNQQQTSQQTDKSEQKQSKDSQESSEEEHYYSELLHNNVYSEELLYHPPHLHPIPVAFPSFYSRSSFPLHTSTLHTSSIHGNPLHASTLHTSPIHGNPIHASHLHASPLHGSSLQAHSFHGTTSYPSVQYFGKHASGIFGSWR